MDDIAQGTRLVIVRHGEAVCNVEEYIGGHASCKGLTERGVLQARALAERLERTGELAGASAFYTSILPRAIQTAEVLAPVLAHSSRDGAALDLVQTCALCERHPGEADGLTWTQYVERYGRRSLPGDVPEEPLSPGGESWAGFLDRAAAALGDLARSHPGELVVVVAHGGVVDASMIRFLDLADHGAGVRLHPHHTSMTEWQHTGAKWRLVRYNDAAHLLEVGPAPRAGGLLSAPPEWVVADPGVTASQQE